MRKIHKKSLFFSLISIFFANSYLVEAMESDDIASNKNSQIEDNNDSKYTLKNPLFPYEIEELMKPKNIKTTKTNITTFKERFSQPQIFSEKKMDEMLKDIQKSSQKNKNFLDDIKKKQSEHDAEIQKIQEMSNKILSMNNTDQEEFITYISFRMYYGTFDELDGLCKQSIASNTSLYTQIIQKSQKSMTLDQEDDFINEIAAKLYNNTFNTINEFNKLIITSDKKLYSAIKDRTQDIANRISQINSMNQEQKDHLINQIAIEILDEKKLINKLDYLIINKINLDSYNPFKDQYKILNSLHMGQPNQTVAAKFDFTKNCLIF